MEFEFWLKPSKSPTSLCSCERHQFKFPADLIWNHQRSRQNILSLTYHDFLETKSRLLSNFGNYSPRHIFYYSSHSKKNKKIKKNPKNLRATQGREIMNEVFLRAMKREYEFHIMWTYSIKINSSLKGCRDREIMFSGSLMRNITSGEDTIWVELPPYQ